MPQIMFYPAAPRWFGPGGGNGAQAQQLVRQAAGLYRRACNGPPGGEAAAMTMMSEAEALARRAIAIDPTLPRSHAQLGHIHLYCHRAEEAETAFREALRLEPGSDRVSVMLAGALAVQGKNGEFLALLGDAIPRLSDYGALDRARRWLVLFAKPSSLPLAEQAATRMIAVGANNSHAFLGLSQVYETWGKLTEAIEAVRQAVQRLPSPDTRPGALRYYTHLAKLLALREDYPAAGAILREAVERRPEDFSLIGSLADTLRFQGDFAKAEVLYDKARALAEGERRRLRKEKRSDDSVDQTYARICLGLGLVRHELGKEEAAWEAVATAVRCDKDLPMPGTESTARQLLFLGDFNSVESYIHARHGRTGEVARDRARGFYLQAFAKTPEDPRVLVRLGKMTYEWDHDVPKAETYLLWALANNPDPETYLAIIEARMSILYRSADQAETMIRQAMVEKPRNAGLHYLLGSLFERRKRYYEANREFLATVALDPKRAAAWLKLFNLRYNDGDLHGAAQALQAFADADPEGVTLEELRFLGQAWAAAEDWPRAIEAYRRFLRLGHKLAFGGPDLKNLLSAYLKVVDLLHRTKTQETPH